MCIRDRVKRLGNIILMIDEVHNIVGAGDAEGSMNAANILKPALSRGEIQVIGATTFNEYRKSIEKDTAQMCIRDRRSGARYPCETAQPSPPLYSVYSRTFSSSTVARTWVKGVS